MSVRDRHRLRQPLAGRVGHGRPARARESQVTAAAAARLRTPWWIRPALGLLTAMPGLEIARQLRLASTGSRYRPRRAMS